MRHEDHGRAGLGGDPGELGLQVLARHLIEGAERLVHEQQPRVLGERTRDRHPLLHAARELVGVPVDELGEPDQLGELGHPCLRGRAVTAVQLERQRDVAGDRAPRQQARLLERDAVLLVDARLRGALAEDLDGSRASPRRGRRSVAAGSTCRIRTAR